MVKMNAADKPRYFATRDRARKVETANMRPQPPRKAPENPFPEELLVYEYPLGRRFRLATLLMGAQTTFFGACALKMYIQPEFGQGLLPTTLACATFSLSAVYFLNVLCGRHIAQIVLEEGGETVRLGHHNALGNIAETTYHVSSLKQPNVSRNQKGDFRYFTIDDGFGYYLYHIEGVLDYKLIQHILYK
eukprot:CAMPEP_0185274772 /NCGR_PEP_ID=MMETSP1359-20130426/52606_1 /TAXON_ID=552665 /ORGANISM="Bigelowiella longifila, Strain CCMP242" /LENGTH=189 /DNA_ID=CAMNT_0027867875 /DNA_START=130 /DNA_END=699 /DNA_ORIENTATION=+